MSSKKYIKRLIEKKIASVAKSFSALVLSGPRQSGKSTTLKKLFGRTHQYVTFDDPLARDKCLSDPRLFFEDLDDKVILDEIQYVPGLLSYIKIAIDNNRNKKGRYIITGSQQFNLIRNLGDTLAGRTGILTLLPFSILELKRAGEINAQKIFIDSCLRGSFPEMFVEPEISAADWYSAYLQTYLERDVRGLHNVGNLADFQKFLQLLSARCAQIINLSSFANDLGVAVNTIKNWLSILAASQIIFFLPPYYRNIGKRMIKSPKIYFVDCGLAAYLTGLKTKEHVLQGPLAGPLFENFVVSEVYKLLSSRGELPRLYYLKTVNGDEIDLLIEAGTVLHPAEIKLTKSPRKEMTAPMGRLTGSSRAVQFAPGRLVCLAEETSSLTRSVKSINVIRYLLKLKNNRKPE